MSSRKIATQVTRLALIVGISLFAAASRADEEKSLRPELQNMVQSVSEKLQAAADKLELTADQRAKIREINSGWAEKRKALRTERQALLQEELKGLGTILTPEQREKVKALVEDRVEEIREAGVPGLPVFEGLRDTLKERVESGADRIGLTGDQRDQIIKALASHSDSHAALRAKCREACEEEFKEVAAVLTPEQREKAREYIELRHLRAAAVKSVADRLEGAADKLGLSADQRRQIQKAHSQFARKYGDLRSERRQLMQEELKSIAAILTPEQREMAKDFWEDRVAIRKGPLSGREPVESAAALKETVAERIEALGNKLGLSADQRNDIRAVHARFADKYTAQREQRKALRQEELKSMGGILTAEQRDKVKNFIEDHSEVL